MPTLRTARITLRLTPEERDGLLRRARESGRTVSAFLREVALGATPRVRSALVSREVVFRLSRIGGELDGLSRNLDRLRPGEVRERLEALRGLVRESLEELSR